MNVRDIMKLNPWTIGEGEGLGVANQRMKRQGIRHLPVTGGGRLVGMLSERDILTARARAVDEAWWKQPAQTAMRSPLHVAHPSDSITEIAGRLAAERIGALVVVERGQLMGIVTVTDVLEAEVRIAMAPG